MMYMDGFADNDHHLRNKISRMAQCSPIEDPDEILTECYKMRSKYTLLKTSKASALSGSPLRFRFVQVQCDVREKVCSWL